MRASTATNNRAMSRSVSQEDKQQPARSYLPTYYVKIAFVRVASVTPVTADRGNLRAPNRGEREDVTWSISRRSLPKVCSGSASAWIRTVIGFRGISLTLSLSRFAMLRAPLKQIPVYSSGRTSLQQRWRSHLARPARSASQQRAYRASP